MFFHECTKMIVGDKRISPHNCENHNVLYCYIKHSYHIINISFLNLTLIVNINI